MYRNVCVYLCVLVVCVCVVVVYLRCLSSLDSLLSICTRKVRHLASFMRTFAHINLRFRHYESTLHFLLNNVRVRHSQRTWRMRNAAQVPQQMALSEMSNELSLIVAPAAKAAKAAKAASAAASPLSNLLTLSSPLLSFSLSFSSLLSVNVMRVFVFD